MPGAAPSNQTLIEITTCYECSPPGEWEIYQLGLLKIIAEALNPMADTTPQNLINLSTCYECAPLYPLYVLGLLTQISNSITGGGPVIGGGAVLCGDADPVAAPTTPCAVFVNRNGGIPRVWTWDANLNKWIAVIQ